MSADIAVLKRLTLLGLSRFTGLNEKRGIADTLLILDDGSIVEIIERLADVADSRLLRLIERIDD